MRAQLRAAHLHVHCRTGSSEKADVTFQQLSTVHCRTGSSEKLVDPDTIGTLVHCRTGSSEIMRNLR